MGKFASFIGVGVDAKMGPYHWTYNRKGRLTLHKGAVQSPCTRVHYTREGVKA